MPDPRGAEPTGLDSVGVAALLVAFIAADEAVVCVGPVRTLSTLALPARNFISGLWGLTACENQTIPMNGPRNVGDATNLQSATRGNGVPCCHR